MQVKPRERLIETAITLFASEGFHATGIDRILAEAGVAKMTLYRHFRSKDDLILAALDRHWLVFRHWLEERLAASPAAPGPTIETLFDGLAAWQRGQTLPEIRFQGFLPIHAAGEFGAADHPIHRAAAAQIQSLTTLLDTASQRVGIDAVAAAQMGLLVVGALTIAHIQSDGRAFEIARDSALALAQRCPAPLPA
nr:TetR/AcrR family transcriptional regulator [Rhodospirillum rubrum]